MKKTESNKIKSVLASRWFLVISLILALFFAFVYARAYYQDYKVKQEIRFLQEEVKSLKKKKIESLEILKYVTSEEFVEEKARTELNLKKTGENVLILQGLGDSDLKQVKITHEEKEKLLTNPIKWWYYFTHKEIK